MANSRSLTVPSKSAEMYWGLYETLTLSSISPSSGLMIPASILTRVVFPVAFGPTIPTDSPILTDPPVMSSSNSPKSFFRLLKEIRSAVCQSPRGGEASNSMGLSLNLMFSSGRYPSR